MTCNKDCEKCEYGIELLTVKCNSKNSTCDKRCYDCPSCEVVNRAFCCKLDVKAGERNES